MLQLTTKKRLQIYKKNKDFKCNKLFINHKFMINK